MATGLLCPGVLCCGGSLAVATAVRVRARGGHRQESHEDADQFTPANPSSTATAVTKVSTQKSAQSGMLRRLVSYHSQQPESEFRMPLRYYTAFCQSLCALAVTLCLVLLGSLFILQSAYTYEAVVLYKAGDTEKVFVIEQDIEGDVLVYYQMHDAILNHKVFVQSKDKRVVRTFLSSVTCEGAESRDIAQSRRPGDTKFLNRIAAVPGTDFAPCGFVALTMFTDEFAFFREVESGTWEAIAADESDVALPADKQAYKDITESSGKLKMGGVDSWLTPGTFFEHWKVWHRTPASPIVRNLWAVIKGGLKKGKYKVHFVENSPTWESWGVREKHLVLSSKPSSLGNKGASMTLAIFCLMFAGIEGVFFVTFSLLSRRPQWVLPSSNRYVDTTPLAEAYGKEMLENE
eukprot:TRINITY_DN17432_c0_g2_i1.p1 TRINITY_DN17432_c0_g2~~TRINITY_DN17432_c0_g2_i1.p1  ORF type:complete len:405 (+),score=75.38 TRINITY_DN17432_c0_g2_i1:121-1335(+)